MVNGNRPYEIELPVQLNIWTRPRCQRAQFEILKKVRPSILIIQSDGGRTPEEWELIRQNRRIYEEEIDWSCTIYKLYEEENRGLYAELETTLAFVFSIVDRCVFLEDDIIPSVSFFRYCRDMLEKYEDDKRIGYISGLNILGVYEKPAADYFFSRRGSVWGYAMWKRTYEQMNDFGYGKDPYIRELLSHATREYPIFRKELVVRAKQPYYRGCKPGVEYGLSFSIYGQHQLTVIPKKNLISNIGFGDDAEHAAALKNLPRRIRRVFAMRTYELDFPLKEATYVIPDEYHTKCAMKLQGDGYPLIWLELNMERLLIHLKNGDLFRWLNRKWQSWNHRYEQLEK